MHSIYFLGYAVMATIAGLIIAQAQYSRMKTEGTPMNFGFLKVVSGIALFMWTAAGLTSVAYSYAA